ncbi:MAG: PhzF family phenazine biosynthesis protein [Gammaproteobacteria bacterium]|jgi:predicted PhzF superfamily epimerase YddE/YHI9|nr:PhzF family phenazine biosynthesis protein [Gammaproteobacteria bacterium]
MQIPIYQVDAFTNVLFEGNPAAVCPLDAWLEDRTLQAIAAENNLSETAFLVGTAADYEIRWFTPLNEVELCGHATLASAWVVFHALSTGLDEIRFASRFKGELIVRRDGQRLVLDFPALPAMPVAVPAGLARLCAGAREILASDDYLAVYDHADAVRDFVPEEAALREMGRRGLIVTAPGDEVDFVSRFFAPAVGVKEDPVTGSAHCILAPYWGEKLGKQELHARQISARGGELWCRLHGERVHIGGHVQPYMEGVLSVPD